MIFEKSTLCHIINHSFIYFTVENCYTDHEKSLFEKNHAYDKKRNSFVKIKKKQING